MNATLLIPALPLLVMAGLLMLVPAGLTAANRRSALVTLLAIQMLGLLLSLLMIRLQAGSDTLTISRIASTALVMLAGGLAAAPLLDRARVGGLVLAATALGILMVPLFLHALLPKLPAISGVALLYAVLLVGVLAGLGGSLQLPRSPARFTASGARRAIPTNGTAIAGGWVILALALTLLGWTMLPPDQPFHLLPLLMSAGIASLLQVMTSRPDDALQKAGEGFAAGTILALMGIFALDDAFLAGLVAGLVVMRSEAIAARLTIDDPSHLIGTILLPALFGLSAPAILGLVAPMAVITWLAVIGGLGVLLSLILWPLTKLTVGLALR